MKPFAVRKSKTTIKAFYQTLLQSYVKHTLGYDEFEKESKKKNVYLLPIEKHGQIVATGSLFITKNRRNRPYYASVHRVSVDPTYRNNGLGKLVNKRAVILAKAVGCSHVFCSCVISVLDIKTRKPNIRQLNICLNKLGYKLTGFRLLDLPDFNNLVDRQYTSTAVVWKPLNKVSLKDYMQAKKTLVNYYNYKDDVKIYTKKIFKNRLNLIETKKTGAVIACSTHIDGFRDSGFLPTYFLPYFGPLRKTVYFGYKYTKTIRSTNIKSNPVNINYGLLKKVISDNEWIVFLKQLQSQILLSADIKFS